MSHKTSPARVAAFFRALEETGNQTIAAERARVSRSWVCLHQSTDPDFRARMEAAIAAARERLRAEATSVGPAAKWRVQAGEELVVRGSNGRRTQIARARLKQWTPRNEARFLATLAACCNVAAACRTVGLSPAAAYLHYRRWPDFAKRWDAALEEGYLRLEMALFDNAGRVFAAVDYPPDIAMPPMDFDQAIALLKFHQHRVHGSGKERRVRKIRRTAEEVFESLSRKLDQVARFQRLKEAEGEDAGRRTLARGLRVMRGDG